MKKNFRRLTLFLVFICMILFATTINVSNAETAESVTRAPYTADWGGEEIAGLYTGDMVNGLPEGFGVLEISEEDGQNLRARHYIGLWQEGLPSGEGTVYWENGDRETGIFRDGVLYNGTRVKGGRETAVISGEEEGTAAAAMDDAAGSAAYIGNRNTKKFHSPSCDSVREMKESNRVEFSNREEAIEAGYKPCGRCNP